MSQKREKTNKWMAKIRNSNKDAGINVKNTLKMILDEQKPKKSMNEDTKIRMQIQDKIINSIDEGKTKLEIIQDLNSVEDFRKYNMFFENWISDRMLKKQKEQNNNKEEMER